MDTQELLAYPLLSLYEHARMLDVLFRQLMLDSAESEAFDERDGLALALRTHAYYRQAISTLDNAGRSGVRPRRKQQTDY